MFLFHKKNFIFKVFFIFIYYIWLDVDVVAANCCWFENKNLHKNEIKKLKKEEKDKRKMLDIELKKTQETIKKLEKQIDELQNNEQNSKDLENMQAQYKINIQNEIEKQTDQGIDTYWLACCHYAKLFTGVNLKQAADENRWTDDITEAYTAGLLVAANGDGELHPVEKEWIIGHQAAHGIDSHILEKADALKDTSLEELVQKFENSPELQACKYFLVYHCFCAAIADGFLAKNEYENTRIMGEALGVDKETVDSIQKLVLKERELYDQKMQLLWKNENPWPFEEE